MLSATDTVNSLAWAFYHTQLSIPTLPDPRWTTGLWQPPWPHSHSHPTPHGWFFLLAATLYLSSIPLHAPLVELGWRQRGRPLEPNDLVSPRFNGEIRCCWDNGRSAPEVKDNGPAPHQAGVRLTHSVMPTLSSRFIFHKALVNCKELFL